MFLEDMVDESDGKFENGMDEEDFLSEEMEGNKSKGLN